MMMITPTSTRSHRHAVLGSLAALGLLVLLAFATHADDDSDARVLAAADRAVYIAQGRQQAINDMRDTVASAYAQGYQAGLIDGRRNGRLEAAQ